MRNTVFFELNFRQRDGNGCALVFLAFKGNVSAQQLDGVLDYGKPEPCAADLLGVAFVHTVEPFKHAVYRTAGIPIPVSATVTDTKSGCSFIVMSTRPPSLLYLTALSQRL